MKKILLAAALLLMSLCFADNSHAGNFGVFGGANFHTSNVKEVGKQTLTQWHAGIVYKFDLPLGFQIHPTLMYNVKAATTQAAPLDFSVGYIEFMPSVQWGADLILFRPYIEVSPFVGYGLNGWGDLASIWKSADRFEYGVGLGGGLQIWRFQVAARYNFTFADLSRVDLETFRNADFNGVSVSLTYFFGNAKKKNKGK
ncbi:MAG: outer membrane beta-barrel protein [Bacteroidales bacterium]|nr:outer membrane beta-barrel protein [Bacteroidales bacterium]